MKIIDEFLHRNFLIKIIEVVPDSHCAEVYKLSNLFLEDDIPLIAVSGFKTPEEAEERALQHIDVIFK